MSKLKFLLAVIGVSFFIYAGAAPYITVYQIKSAIDLNDGERLSEYIDFEKLRQSLKDQMNAKLAGELAKNEKAANNSFVQLGSLLAGAFIEKAIDAIVTPSGIAKIMSGENPTNERKERNGSASKQNRDPLSAASMSYKSLEKFVVTIQSDKDEEIRLILRRQGIDWKLTEILLPNF